MPSTHAYVDAPLGQSSTSKSMSINFSSSSVWGRDKDVEAIAPSSAPLAMAAMAA